MADGHVGYVMPIGGVAVGRSNEPDVYHLVAHPSELPYVDFQTLSPVAA